jgi:hypothetical protein
MVCLGHELLDDQMGVSHCWELGARTKLNVTAFAVAALLPLPGVVEEQVVVLYPPCAGCSGVGSPW